MQKGKNIKMKCLNSYKRTPANGLTQIAISLCTICSCIGTALVVEGIEADDVIGTLALQASSLGKKSAH